MAIHDKLWYSMMLYSHPLIQCITQTTWKISMWLCFSTNQKWSCIPIFKLVHVKHEIQKCASNNNPCHDTPPFVRWHEAPWQLNNENSSQDPLQSLLAWVIVMDCAELMSGVHPYCICRVKSLMHKIQQNFLQTVSPPPQKISLKMQASHWSRLITWPKHCTGLWLVIRPLAAAAAYLTFFPFLSSEQTWMLSTAASCMGEITL